MMFPKVIAKVFNRPFDIFFSKSADRNRAYGALHPIIEATELEQYGWIRDTIAKISING